MKYFCILHNLLVLNVLIGHYIKFIYLLFMINLLKKDRQ